MAEKTTRELLVWGVPDHVKAAFKAQCAATGRTMASVVVDFMESFARCDQDRVAVDADAAASDFIEAFQDSFSPEGAVALYRCLLARPVGSPDADWSEVEFFRDGLVRLLGKSELARMITEQEASVGQCSGAAMGLLVAEQPDIRVAALERADQALRKAIVELINSAGDDPSFYGVAQDLAKAGVQVQVKMRSMMDDGVRRLARSTVQNAMDSSILGRKGSVDPSVLVKNATPAQLGALLAVGHEEGGDVQKVFAADSEEYDANCPACLRGMPHSMAGHEERLARVRAASFVERTEFREEEIGGVVDAAGNVSSDSDPGL